MIDSLPAWITAIATVVYTIITIRILKANQQTVAITQEQLLELSNQTKVNVGLQLYEKRMNVYKKLINKEYEDIMNDVIVLFGIKYSLELDRWIQKEKLTSANANKRDFNNCRYDIEFQKLCTMYLDYIYESIQMK